MKRVLIFVLFPLLFGCVSMINDLKELNLAAFKITTPKNWRYKKAQGIDSFIGEITGPGISLSFDFSDRGYANSLLPTEQEYLKKEGWKRESYFYKAGVTYTADFDVKKERAAQMKKLGTTDSTLVHVEADPSYETKTNIHLPTTEQKLKYPQADYIADMTYKDSTIYIPIEIPPEIKSVNINIDSAGKYIIKTIWPKTPTKGMTGIYIKSKSSTLNFQMSTNDLSKQNQELALQAFRTIVIKTK